jgi:CRISPR type IV-associated protein Csf2
MIRRAVVKCTGEKTPWSVDTHYMLTQGVDTTNQTLNEKVSGIVSVESELREQNPFLSLFGRWRLPGHLGMDNAIPVTDGTGETCLYVHGRGARSNDFVRTPSQVAFLSVDEAKRLKEMVEQDALAAQETGDIDDQIKLLKKDYQATKDQDEKRELGEQLNVLQAKKKDVKAAKKGSQESIQRPLEGFEAIKPGTRLKHKMMIQNASDMELGLYLATLREFARNPYVGGHRSLGCGEISGVWSVSYWPEDEVAPISLGEIKLSSSGFEVIDSPDSKLLTNSLKCWDDTAQKLVDAGINFERFMLSE